MNNMQKLTGVILMALAIVLIWSVREPVKLTCEQKRQAVAASIDSKNYCTVDSDCASYAACPFACQIAVNKGELAEMQKTISDYNQQCGQGCWDQCPHMSVICSEGKCALKQ